MGLCLLPVGAPGLPGTKGRGRWVMGVGLALAQPRETLVL